MTEAGTYTTRECGQPLLLNPMRPLTYSLQFVLTLVQGERGTAHIDH
jgi:hypothetical protein